ncbi:MAG: hypothetical protein OSB42_12460 [Planctomycetota bacterium]|nr:hypothetical protein [Planctomycetota bacterium]
MGRVGLLLCLGFLAGCAAESGISPRPLPTASRWAPVGERLVLVDRDRGMAIAEPGVIPQHLREPLEGALGVSSGELTGGHHAHPAVVLFQAGAWRLAEAWFNGALSDGEYAQQFELLVTRCLGMLDGPTGGTRSPVPKVVPVPAVMVVPEALDTESPCGECRGVQRGLEAGLQLTERGFIL